MNKQEKEQFIKEFMERVQDSLLIKLDRVPEDWNGIELREWIADTFDFERKGNLPPSRRKKYRNDLIIHNL